jgi:ribose transport system substrate-binding protein
VLLLSGTWIYFQKTLEQVELEGSGKNKVYKKHYIMIADEDRTMLWRSIYESARAEAGEADAYLELMQPGENDNYSQADCLRIGIACKPDGIILEPDGSQEVRELIEEAALQEIPVVTVLEDDSDSRRISFVGLNSYQLGEAYGDQALALLGEEDTQIMVLMNAESRDSGSNLAYSQIVRTIEQRKDDAQNVTITAYEIENSGEFTSEEAIRDIFLNQETLPDILICMDEVNTECAYQALVDYNKVGDIEIIGYYYSDLILSALQRGILPATIALDSEEIGRYSIDALEEYVTLGYASNYYSVGLNVITPDNVSSFVTDEAAGEESE